MFFTPEEIFEKIQDAIVLDAPSGMRDVLFSSEPLQDAVISFRDEAILGLKLGEDEAALRRRLAPRKAAVLEAAPAHAEDGAQEGEPSGSGSGERPADASG